MRPVIVAHHTRSGVVALNVVTAALQSDPRTASVEVRFARDRERLAADLRDAAVRGDRPVAFWSFYSPDALVSAEDLAWVRANAPGALHVAGGVHATAEPLATLRAGFDLVAVGEGEATAVSLLRRLLDGGNAREAPGTAHLEGGRLVSRGPGERRPLDDFPAFNVRAGKWNAIEITRGCIYACSFCQTPFMFKARFRHRSVGNVVEHVEAMKRDGIGYLRFLTPTALSYGSLDASVNLDAVEELLARMREALPRGKIYFGTFPSECRPEHVTHESLRVLSKHVDNRQLVIGGQSGSARVLRETHRGHTVDDVERAVRLAVEHGFEPDVDFLLGLPGESSDDRELSIAFARKLAVLGARIHSHAFMPLPGTPLAGATPSAIEEPVRRAMERLESEGAMHGQWRRHERVAQQLVALKAGGRG